MIFAGVFGVCLGLVLVKLGNPVILDRMVEPPRTFLELVFNSWPVSWGYWMLGFSLVAAIPVLRDNHRPTGIIILLPVIWLSWQLVAATRSVDSGLSVPTIIHFGGSVLCFYLGLRALVQGRPATLFWTLLLICFAWVLWIGFTQQFGGLESTRRVIREQPDWQNLPPEYLKRIESGRVFATFVYPNALAGAILLLIPPLIVITWRITASLSNIPRGIFTGLLVYGGLACLAWSGSKAGWLIALILGSIALLRVGMSSKRRWLAVAMLCLLGVSAFAVKYQRYFEKGATSVGARLDYWSAAWRTAESNPVFGTGPGTFSVRYREMKRPESEMTRLVHNDFLEQACDSGWMGFLAYTSFILASLVLLYRKTSADRLVFAAWLGVLGWSLQGFVEFGLYIPALAWPAFAIIGWLWSVAPIGFDIRAAKQ